MNSLSLRGGGGGKRRGGKEGRTFKAGLEKKEGEGEGGLTRFLKEKGGIFTPLSITVVLGAATATTSCLDEQEGFLGTLCAVSGIYESRRKPHCVLCKPPLKGVVSGSKVSPGGGSSIQVYTVYRIASAVGKKEKGLESKS